MRLTFEEYNHGYRTEGIVTRSFKAILTFSYLRFCSCVTQCTPWLISSYLSLRLCVVMIFLSSLCLGVREPKVRCVRFFLVLYILK